MRTLRLRTLAPAALALVLALPACSSTSARRPAPPEVARRTARLDLQLVDRLGRRWTIDYMQVYVDGWLVWQGVPNGSRSLGRPSLPATGKQELYVRVVATNGGSTGHLASGRTTVRIRPGAQRVQIKLSPDLVRGGIFHVSLRQG